MKPRAVVMVVVLIVVGAGAAMIGITASGSGSGKAKTKVLGEQITAGSSSTTATTAKKSAQATSTTTGSESATTTTAAVGAGTQSQPAPAQATTTTIVCRNSFNPACGTFRWDPAPAAAGHATMTMTYTPTSPKAGDQVSFTVEVNEPNTSIGACSKLDFGDGLGIDCQQTAHQPNCAKRYGPWTPPAKKPSHITETFSHHYDKAGTFTLTVVHPLGSTCYDPYQGKVSGSFPVVVK